jgi:hypothetical protein
MRRELAWRALELAGWCAAVAVWCGVLSALLGGWR